jgi:hypothetical protein
MNPNRLKSRIEALESATDPKVITTWADLMKCTADQTVMVSDEIAALFVEEGK